jgi:hypothetical protein
MSTKELKMAVVNNYHEMLLMYMLVFSAYNRSRPSPMLSNEGPPQPDHSGLGSSVCPMELRLLYINQKSTQNDLYKTTRSFGQKQPRTITFLIIHTLLDVLQDVFHKPIYHPSLIHDVRSIHLIQRLLGEFTQILGESFKHLLVVLKSFLLHHR